jgi:glyoxylase-like metal-dependent hydrolase (beta-lactamase superfamily II)
MATPLYFKQIEIGPMQNYVYLIGSTETREAAVVDAAWNIDEIVRIAAQDEMEITHALVTHTHPDHVGGGFAGMEIAGVTELLEKCKAKVVVHKAEAEFIKGLSSSDMIKTDNGDKVDVGGVEVQLMHTPGHTPGSQCFLVENRVVSGDTLFIDACGRVDFTGGNPEQMYYKHATLGEQKKSNPYLKFSSLKQFLGAMGYR